MREDGGAIWAVGNGPVQCSSDQGLKWRSMKTGSKSFSYSVAADGAGRICVGGAGSVAWTRDDGAAWHLADFGHHQYMRGAVVFASGEMVLVGDDGRIHRMVRGQFRACESGTEHDLYDVCCVRGRELVAVGHDIVLQSKDGGARWTATPMPGVWLNSVAARSGRVIAVGSKTGGGGVVCVRGR
jgi:photosystem II stability/assembly factor-like uncharacterized protein